MDNLIKELKRSKKMNKFARTTHSYKKQQSYLGQTNGKCT